MRRDTLILCAALVALLGIAGLIGISLHSNRMVSKMAENERPHVVGEMHVTVKTRSGAEIPVVGLRYSNQTLEEFKANLDELIAEAEGR